MICSNLIFLNEENHKVQTSRASILALEPGSLDFRVMILIILMLYFQSQDGTVYEFSFTCIVLWVLLCFQIREMYFYAIEEHLRVPMIHRNLKAINQLNLYIFFFLVAVSCTQVASIILTDKMTIK